MIASTARERRVALTHALATTTTIQVLSTMSALALTAIAPTVAAQIGIEAHYVGYQISLIYAAGMATSAAAGTLVDRHGAVRIEQFALAMFALGLCGLATGRLWLMALASLAIGVGYGLQNPASSQILSAVTPRARRSLVFSIKQAGVPAGGVFASLLFPLLSPVLGWQVSLLVAAVPSLAMIAVLARNHAGEVHHPPTHRQNILKGFISEQRLVLGRPALRDLAMLGLFYSSLQLSLSAFTVTLLVAQGWGLVAAGAAAGLVNLCGAVGRVTWGGVADRWHAGLPVLAFIGLASAACMLAIDVLPLMPLVLQLMLLGVLGFCLSGWNGVLMAEMTHHCAPQDTSRVIGGALVYTFLGVTIGPAGFALLYDWCGSYGRTFQIVSVVAVAGGVLALRAARRRKPA